MTPTNITEKIKQAYDDGYEAGRLGGSTVCPYYYAVHRVLEERWRRGLRDGQNDRIDSEKERSHD